MSTAASRWILGAFALGAAVHLALLALAYGPFDLTAPAAFLLLVAAFPAAVVDMSAEVLHPNGLGTGMLVAFASLVNGAFYVGLAALGRLLLRLRDSRSGRSR